MDEDVGSGEGFQSEFLLADMFHEDLLQLFDDMFFVFNLSVDLSINARSLSSTALVACVLEEHQ